MHESGVIRQLIDAAYAEAGRRGSSLRGIEIRLGALAGGTAAHLREHFELELRNRGLTAVALRIVERPDHLAGVELTGLELSHGGREA